VGELKRTLQSLACGQKRVLRKYPLGKDIDETDVFYFNADFTDPRAKVHINSIQAKETVSKNYFYPLSYYRGPHGGVVTHTSV